MKQCNPSSKDFFRVLAWGRYLYSAELARRDFGSHVDAEEEGKLAPNTVRSVILAFRWCSSLYVVIEGWRELKLSDPLIDSYFRKHGEFVDLFRRARNAMFHYQDSLVDPRLIAVAEDEATMPWIMMLHLLFVEYFAGRVLRTMGSLPDKNLALSVEEIVGWFPWDSIAWERFRLRETIEEFQKLVDETPGNPPHKQEAIEQIAESKQLLRDLEVKWLEDVMAALNSGQIPKL